MVLAELLSWVFGSVDGIATIALLIVVGNYARKGARVGDVMSTTGIFAIVLGVLALTGVVSIDVGALVEIVGMALDAVSGLFGVVA